MSSWQSAYLSTGAILPFSLPCRPYTIFEMLEFLSHYKPAQLQRPLPFYWFLNLVYRYLAGSFGMGIIHEKTSIYKGQYTHRKILIYTLALNGIQTHGRVRTVEARHTLHHATNL
jgi:hypothetical protein